jgi:hypothetical protein
MFLHAALTIILGIISGLASHRYGLTIIKGTVDQNISVLGTTAQISVSMMGFMLAALAILASITDKPLVKNMAHMGLFKDLLMSLFTACTLYTFSFLIAESVLIIGDYGMHWREILIGALVASLIATIQIGWKFWKVLSNLNITP